MANMLAAIVRELTTRHGYERVPEQDMVMTEERSVDSYARAGETNGGLSGNYAFTADQMCEVFGPGDVVLDVGCGPAGLLLLMAQLNPDVRFIGVDLSDSMLDKGRRAVEARGLTNVELRRDDMTTLATVGDQSVHAVLSHMALHHLPDESALNRSFAAIVRVRKPGGGIYLSDFTRFRSAGTVDILAESISREDPVAGRDFDHSLRAAFSKAELTAAATRHFGNSVRVYGSRLSLFLAIKSAPRRATHPGRGELQRIVKELPSKRRAEMRSMQVPLRLAGLRSQL